jgi:hypothetical protein
MASDRYTHRSPSQRKERRASNRSANHPPPRRERRRPPEQNNHPPSQHVERESLLSRLKRQTAFWIIGSIGALVIFVLVGLIYGAAGNLGLVNTDLWMANFGMICGLVGSWWLYGQFLKKKFGYSSIFQ